MQTEPFVEEVWAMFADKPCNLVSPASQAADWENRLTDLEWIDLWASIFSVELMNNFVPATSTFKQ